MKIKIMICKWNKALENKEIEVKKISKHHDNHGHGNSKPPKWFTDYMNKFKQEINDRLDNLVKKNNLIE